MNLDAPLDVYWSLTQGCNLACDFCFTESAPGTTAHDLAVEQRARILEQILAAGVLRVTLTGGEPFTAPDCMEITERLRAAGRAVKITTNGTLLRPAVVTRLAELGVRLQFSIESADPAINDAVMGGTDTVARILGGLRRARAAGIPCVAKVTLQRATLPGFGELLEVLHREGVEKVDVSEVLPLGRAVENWSALEASPAQLREAAAVATAARERGLVVDYGATQLQNAEAGVPAGCSLGTPRPRTVLIDERGDMRPCAASQTFGWPNSVLEHGLLGAWERLTELGRFRDADALEGECRECDLVETCKGGCRGGALAAWGHTRGPDPHCPRLGVREGRRFYGREVVPVTLVFPDGTVEGPA